MKPRVMSLVIFTCAVGLLVSPIPVNLFDAMISIFFVAVGAGAAGTLNMWYEADLDKLMTRTCLRPIPTGKVEKKDALLFGVLLSIVSVAGLYYFSNLISEFLLLITIAFYVFVYTIWLKRKTPQNIVIGGASGALPPVIGWTIATNSLTIEPITLFLIIFYWTPSHFWALSLYKAKDYQKAKIPMLPNTNGVEETKRKIITKIKYNEPEREFDSKYKPTKEEIETFPDLQNGPSSLIQGAAVEIQQVGIHNFRIPLKYKTRDNGIIELETKVTGTVSLEAHKKGINMSRIMRSFYNHKDETFSINKIKDVLETYKENLMCFDSRIMMKISYPNNQPHFLASYQMGSLFLFYKYPSQ